MRLQRLKDYMQMFGLNSENAVGLDLVVHGPEYREE